MNTERASDQPVRWPSYGTRGFSEATALVLERAREVEHATTRAMLPVELREAIVLLCAQAHTERMTVERVIVELKEGWSALPEVRRLPRGTAHEALLAVIITQCILDFYPDGGLEGSSDRRPRIHGEPRT